MMPSVGAPLRLVLLVRASLPTRPEPRRGGHHRAPSSDFNTMRKPEPVRGVVLDDGNLSFRSTDDGSALAPATCSDHRRGRRPAAHGRSHPALRSRRRDDIETLPGNRLTAARRRHRPGDVRSGQVDAGCGRRAAQRAEAASHPAQRGLAHRPGRGLPGALPVLLPRRLAHRAADDPRLRQPRRRPRRDRRARRPGNGHQRHARRAHEGTTFERPATPIRSRSSTSPARWPPRSRPSAADSAAPVQPALHHQVRRRRDAASGSTTRGRTRVRFSRQRRPVAGRFEGGTATMPQRVCRRCGRWRSAGYPVGLTIAPVMPVDGLAGRRTAQLLDDVAAARRRGAGPGPDRRAITHRFTPGSKEVLLGLVPAHPAGDGRGRPHPEALQVRRRQVRLPRDVMAEMRTWFAAELGRELPPAASSTGPDMGRLARRVRLPGFCATAGTPWVSSHPARPRSRSWPCDLAPADRVRRVGDHGLPLRLVRAASRSDARPAGR